MIGSMSSASWEDMIRKLQALGDLENQKPMLREYFRTQLSRYGKGHSMSEEVAYEIAGLLSLESVRSAADKDPYVAILLMAAELELPARQ